MKKLEQSSLSVKPSDKNENKIINLTFLNIETIDEFSISLKFTNYTKMIVKLYEKDIINLQIIYKNKIMPCKNKMNLPIQNLKLENEKIIGNNFELVIEKNGYIKIKNSKNELIIKKIYIENSILFVNIKTNESEKFYGFGEKTGMSLDKKYTNTSNYATDLYKAHSDQDLELYGALNFNIINKGLKNNVGIYLDNASRTFYDMRTENDFLIGVQKNDLDLFVILENSIKSVIKKYYYITGFPMMPSKWSLGHHLSKHSYENTEVVKNLVKNSVENDLKLDAIYLDILYMDKYKSFTVDKNRYENLKDLVAFCQKNNVEIVPIVNPGFKIDENFELYKKGKDENAFILNKNKKPFYGGEVWPGICSFPDFFNDRGVEFWKNNFEFYLEKNIRGIWLDMNEPAVFNEIHVADDNAVHSVDDKFYEHSELHNNYGTFESKYTYEAMTKNNLRPHLVSRAFSAGIQKYSTVWTGDNFSYWFQLQQSLPMIMNLSLSGVPISGQDIGGFEYDASAELLTRWYQANILFGLFRNHCSFNRKPQEPWTFNEKTTMAISKVVKFRNEYLPTIYSQMYLSHNEGNCYVKPLLYNFEEDKKSYNIDDQYMVGPIMIAPILKQNTFSRLVYLPNNRKGWVDYFENKYLEGNQNIIKDLDYSEFGVFIENNSMLFKTKKDANKYDYFKNIEVEIYNFNNEKVKIVNTFYDDDGISLKSIEENSFEEIEFIYENKKITANCKNKNIDLNYIENKFTFFLINENGKSEIKIGE